MVESPKVFDFHTHTNKTGFIKEGVPYSPTIAVERAKEVGLDGIAITDHDSVSGLGEAMEVGARLGVVVVPGMEITSLLWRGFPHILALGIDLTGIPNNRAIPTGQSPERVIHWIHDNGGLAIAAHPGRGRSALTLEEVRRYGEILDGVETLNLSGHKPNAEWVARQFGLIPLGSSDSHMLAKIGLVGTKLPGTVETWQDAMQAIRGGPVEAFVRTDIPPELQGSRGPGILLRQVAEGMIARLPNITVDYI